MLELLAALRPRRPAAAGGTRRLRDGDSLHALLRNALN